MALASLFKAKIIKQLEGLNSGELLIYKCSEDGTDKLCVYRDGNRDFFKIWDENESGEISNLVRYSSLENTLYWIMRSAVSPTPGVYKNKIISFKDAGEEESTSLKENVEDNKVVLSEAAKNFIKKYPEYKDLILRFEGEWSERGKKITDSSDFLNIVIDDFIPNYNYEDEDGFRGQFFREEFGKPEIIQFEYYKEGKDVYVDVTLSATATATVYGSEHYDGYYNPPYYDEKEVEVEARMYISLLLPKKIEDLGDINRYEIYGGDRDDIEYEVL